MLDIRSSKYPNFLNIAIALIKRALNAKLHLAQNRFVSLLVKVYNLHIKQINNSFYSFFEYYINGLLSSRIFIIAKFKTLKLLTNNLKAFSAAFKIAASAFIFYIVEITLKANLLKNVLNNSQKVKKLYIIRIVLINIEKSLIMPRKIKKLILYFSGIYIFRLSK